MRKLLLIIGMLLSFQSFGVGMNTDAVRSYVYCVEGYKFIYTFSNSPRGGVTVTQVLEYSAHVGMVPLQCDSSEPYRVAYEPIKTKK